MNAEREKTPPGARALTLTWVALMVLATASLGFSFFGLGRWGVLVAMGIAVVKASLVAVVFMELAVHRFTVRLVLVAVVVFFAILVGFMVADVKTRTVEPLVVPIVRHVPAPGVIDEGQRSTPNRGMLRA